MSPLELPVRNHPLPSTRRSDVEAITSLLFTITLVLSLSLGALAAGTRLSRTLARRRER